MAERIHFEPEKIRAALESSLVGYYGTRWNMFGLEAWEKSRKIGETIGSWEKACLLPLEDGFCLRFDKFFFEFDWRQGELSISLENNPEFLKLEGITDLGVIEVSGESFLIFEGGFPFLSRPKLILAQDGRLAIRGFEAFIKKNGTAC